MGGRNQEETDNQLPQKIFTLATFANKKIHKLEPMKPKEALRFNTRGRNQTETDNQL